MSRNASRSAVTIAAGWQQPHDGAADGRLAGSGFADDAELLAPEREATRRARPAPCPPPNAISRFLDSISGLCHSVTSGIEDIAQRIADEVEGEADDARWRCRVRR